MANTEHLCVFGIGGFSARIKIVQVAFDYIEIWCNLKNEKKEKKNRVIISAAEVANCVYTNQLNRYLL